MTAPTPFTGAHRYADTVYNRRAPGAQQVPASYVDPSGYSSFQQQLVDDTLAAESLPADVLVDIIRPPLPLTQRFPDRFVDAGAPLTAREILSAGDVDWSLPGGLTERERVARAFAWEQSRLASKGIRDPQAQFSGTSGSYSGSARPGTHV